MGKPHPKKTVEIAQLWQHNRGNYTTPTIFQKKERNGTTRGPNAVLKKIKNGNFKVTSRFLGREKKKLSPLRGGRQQQK